MPRAWHARAYGGVADLDVEFDDADRAGTVTALLASCVTDERGRAIDVDEAWDWTLNERLHALIAVRLASGDASVEVHAVCGDCGEAMEAAIDLRALPSDPAAPRFVWRDENGVDVTLRLPRGRDVQRWTREGVRSPEMLAASLVDAVAGEPVGATARVPASWLPALDEAFEAHDPLTALRLHTACPACGRETSIACDLERLLVSDFARVQSNMLAEVSRLASVFHWSEAEILALPRWRRARYLRQIDGERWT
jgi:hypothetical protein